MKTVYPTTNKVCGGYNYKVSFMDLRLKTSTLVFGVPKDTDIFSVKFWEPRSQYSKTCLKRDKTKVLKTDGSLMQVETIAECSLRAFCNTFDLH